MQEEMDKEMAEKRRKRRKKGRRRRKRQREEGELRWRRGRKKQVLK